MSYLIEILLPVRGDAHAALAEIRTELTEAFGGVTIHATAPAEGLWKSNGDIDRDRIVIVEVMADEIERVWWAVYRRDLETRLKQEEIVIRATPIERL